VDAKAYPVTPDGRYFVVNQRLWRCTDPALGAEALKFWVDRLMRARREVGVAKRAADREMEKAARAQVDEAKRALGERGPVWWTDGAPDLNRRLVKNTPYSEWFDEVTAAPGG